MQHFNLMISTKLQSYVYALADPRVVGSLKDRIFYVGKGKNSRCFNHAAAARGQEDQPLNDHQHKLSTIHAIHNARQEVEVHIVAHGLTDNEAFTLEAALIPLVGDTNAVAGHGDQLMWLQKNQIDELYDKPIERGEVELLRGNILFVNLNQQNTDALRKAGAEDQLAYATLGDWNLGEPRSRLVDCLIGVKHGLIVSVFKIEKTIQGIADFERILPKKSGAHGRSRFVGTRAYQLEGELVSRSVFNDDVMLSKLRPGAGCQFFPAMEKLPKQS